MLTIEIKEDFDDPKERARRAAAKRKQKEAERTTEKRKSGSRQSSLFCTFAALMTGLCVSLPFQLFS